MNSIINNIRKFNRFYTNILGLLDNHMLDSNFSLAEIRVLYDIGHIENCTAKKLVEEIKIDPGYLSRIIKRFVKDDLVSRIKSELDGRLYYINLTHKGEEVLEKLDDLSNRQVNEMISVLSEEDQANVVIYMNKLQKLISGKTEIDKDDIIIRSDLRAGDVGLLIYLHGYIYKKECGYNHIFEGYVCKTFYEFFMSYSPQKDKFWFAEDNGEMIGAIAIVGHSEERAQLRWFILHPDYRGFGLGRTLLDKAMDYCREKGYKSIFLYTTKEQVQAVGMYKKAGFKKTSEKENSLWGKALVEETYEACI